MTRWLKAAKSGLGGSDKTDKTDKTSVQEDRQPDVMTSQTVV